MGGEELSNFKHNPKTIIDEQEGKRGFHFLYEKFILTLLYTQLFPFL